MVKSLNTRFLNKKKDSILNSSIKKQTLSFTQKKIQKKGQFNLLACKNSDVAKQKKKLKRKITKTPLYPRKKKIERQKKIKALAINAVVFGLFQRLDLKKKHKYIVRCSMPEWRVRNTNKKNCKSTTKLVFVSVIYYIFA